MLLNIFMVVYRESFEAVLIVTILWAILRRQPDSERYREPVLSGILGGFAVSLVLALGLLYSQSELSAQVLEYFNFGLLFLAVLLITHMCIWMKRHGSQIKGELQQRFLEAKNQPNRWAIRLLAASAVAREGIETVIFLFGSFYESKGAQLAMNCLVACLGLVAAIATWFLLNKGIAFIRPKRLFAVTSFFLFLTASHFLVQISKGLIQSEILPALQDPAYDVSSILPDTEGFGSVLSSFAGYQAAPALTTVILWWTYWIIALALYYRAGRDLASTAAMGPRVSKESYSS